MNILSLFSFLNFILCILVTAYIFRLSSRASITVTYALLLFGVALWSLCYTFIYPETDEARLWFWYKLSSPGWLYIQSLGLHFCLILAESPLRKKKRLLTFLYGIPTILLVRVLRGPLLISGFRQGPWGAVEIVAPFGLWTAMFVLFFLSFFLCRLFILTRFVSKAPRRNLKNQAVIFIFTDCWIFAAALIFNVFVPSLPNNTFPSVGNLFAVVTPILVWFSIKEHKLFYYNLFLDSISSSPAINRSILFTLFNLRDVFDRMQAGLAVIDKNHTILDANEKTETLFGRRPDHATPCYRYYHHRQEPCSDCLMRLTEGSKMYDLVHVQEGDQWVENHSFLLVQKEGEPDGVLKISFDVTDRIRAQRRREDMERVIQHDIRNGLMGILGAAQMLLDFPMQREKREYVDLIYRNSLNLKNTINSSLELFKMEEGAYRLVSEEFDLIPILRRIMWNLEKLAVFRNVSFRVLVRGRPLGDRAVFVLYGSPLQVENLLTNLLKNAVEASPPGKTVTVTLNDASGTFIDVHNYGVIPEEIRDRFFRKYVTYNKENGLGLGAYSARVIARAHGGDITYSTGEVEGTHMFVRLPMRVSRHA